MKLICDVRSDLGWQRITLPGVIPGDTVIINDVHGEVIRITLVKTDMRKRLHDALNELRAGLRQWLWRPA